MLQVPRLLPHVWVFRLLGVLLFVTALLKLQGIAADPVARRGVFTAPELQLAIIEVEVLLGVWLWWGG
jgi:hypothetical protein